MRIVMHLTIISVLIILKYQFVLCGRRNPQFRKRLIIRGNLKHSRRIYIIKCCGGSKCSASFMRKPPRRSSDFKTNTTHRKPSNTQGPFKTSKAKNFSSDLEHAGFENTAISVSDTTVFESNIAISESDASPSVPNKNPIEITKTFSSHQGFTSSKPTKLELTAIVISQSDTTKLIAENTLPQKKAESTTDPPTSTSPAAEAKKTQTTAATKTNLVTTTTTTTPTSTTATTKPINDACELSRCANFTYIANQRVSSVIGGNTSKLIVRNGMTFLFSSAAVSQVDAARNCFSRNLVLISVQDTLKMSLLQKLLTDVGTASAVWTIGSNEGDTSCKNYNLSFAWCNPKREVILPAMMQKLNSLEIVQKGLTTSMLNGAAVLKTSDSNSLFPFLCEPKDDFQDSCLPFQCNKDMEKSMGSGRVTAINYTFSLASFLGMRPIWFSSTSDFGCLSNATKEKWALNWNYWTAGRAMGTWGRWAWCPGAFNLPDSLSWGPGQPDNAQPDELCLHLQVTKNASGILLSDRNCSHKYVIACQGDALMASNSSKPNCPMECTKNESFFTNGIIKDLYIHGQWNAGCGKDYLFSNATLDWLGAWKYCCSVGMKLASIEALEELNCLTNMVAKYPKAVYPDQCGRDLWTSGTNRGCPGSHYWCSENEKLNKEEIAKWKNGKMPSESSDQCIFINLSNSTLSETYLGADSCTKQKPFLCETFQPGTKSVQISRTCKEIWNVTDSEVIDIIMNPSGDVVNQRLNLKCYLRCCGKKGNVIKTGSLVTDQILRNLEDLTSDDPQAMQDGFQIFDSCTSIRMLPLPTQSRSIFFAGSTDECDMMARMFQCGKKNAPDLTLGLVTAIKGDANVLVTAAGGIKTGDRTCPLYPVASCVPNQAKIDELKNTGSTLGGSVMTLSTGKKYFIKFVSGITDAQAEANYCCTLGSHLAIFESLEDFNAFLNDYIDKGGVWIYIGPTFDNGDGTDSWCLNFKRLPAGMITDINLFYRNQNFNSTQIYLAKSPRLLIYSKGGSCNIVLCGPLSY